MSGNYYIPTPELPDYDTELDILNLEVFETPQEALSTGRELIAPKVADLGENHGVVSRLQRVALGWEDIALGKTDAVSAFDVYGIRKIDETEQSRGVVAFVTGIFRKK